jgi:DNA polymerase III epsilon subunit-like protein
MNFYLDFEATQFSEEIINIGCVADNGEEFDTLVRPSKIKNVTEFITNLTGITREMVTNADCPDLCFLALRQFIRDQSNGEETFFFVYGNADNHFIERTVAKMIDPEAKKFAYKLGASLIDFSTIVQRFFRMGSISLKNAVAYFRQEEVAQTHEALDDAELLRELVYMVNHCDVPETIDMSHMTTKSGKFKKKKAQIDIQSADIDTVRTNNGHTLPALKIPTELDVHQWCDVPMDWYPKGTLLRIDHKGKVERPFTCIENAYAAIRAKHGSNQSCVTIRTTIINAINNKAKAYGKYWAVV